MHCICTTTMIVPALRYPNCQGGLPLRGAACNDERLEKRPEAQVYPMISALFPVLVAAAAAIPSYLQPDEANTIAVFQNIGPNVVNISNVRLERYLFSLDMTE